MSNISENAQKALIRLLEESLIIVRNTDNLKEANALGYMAHNVPGILAGEKHLKYFVKEEAPHWLGEETIPERIKKLIRNVCLAAEESDPLRTE